MTIPANSSRKAKTNTRKKRIFTKKDYNSGDGMLTLVWGPPMWHFLHTMSFNYPVEPSQQQKKQYLNFVYSLQNVLPCGKCRENLKLNMKELPLTINDMKSRETFSKYIYTLHEHINKMLNKKSGLSYCDVRERYEHFRARCISIPPLDQSSIKKNTRKTGHKGCTESMHGMKSKCVLKIVPENTKCESLEIKEK